VEVLAALVLIGVVLPIAMRGITLSMAAAAHARHLSEAGALAESKLKEMQLSGDTSTFAGTGDFGVDWPEYRWEASSVTRDNGCYEVTIRISWKERQAELSTDLSTLIYPSATSSTGTSVLGGTQ
jgi:type II secretory pathway pseudopilin PulG